MARLINNSWVAATPPTGKTITNYSLENNGVQVIEVGNVLVANGVSVGDEAINTRVRAKYNDNSYGPYSNVVTIAAASAPAAPTNLQVGTETDTTIPLSWTKSITGVMTEYRVYKDNVLLQTFSGDVASGTLTGLTPSTPYTNLTVRAYNGTSESANSNAVTGATEASQSNVAAPTNFAAGTIGQDIVLVNWTNSVTPGITEYRVYDDNVLIQTLDKNHTLQFAIAGLEPGTAYANITLRAWNGAEESGNSNAINFTTLAGEFTGEIKPSLTYYLATKEPGVDVWKVSVGNSKIIANTQPVSGDGHIIATANNMYYDMWMFVRPSNSTERMGAAPTFGIKPDGSARKWFYQTTDVEDVIVQVNTGIDVMIGDKYRIVRSGSNVKGQYQRLNSLTWVDIRDFGNATVCATGDMFGGFASTYAECEVASIKILQ